MAKRSEPRLTPLRHQQIVSAIRAGGFPQVAAQAYDVPAPLLDAWLKRGQAPRAREPYRSFAHDVDTALAQARLRAETELFVEEPKRWLANGPGRDSTDNPGWSIAVKPVTTTSATRSALLDPEFLQLVHELLEALRLFPEAHRHVIQLPALRSLFKAA